MAYDKIVDSSALDAGLKQVADAIREKGGTAASLAFPAAMVSAIESIQSGGSLPAGVTALTGGSVTASSNVYGLDVLHNLGVMPNFAVAVAEGPLTADEHANFMVAYLVCVQQIGAKSAHFTRVAVTSAGVTSAIPNVIAEADIPTYVSDVAVKLYGYAKAGLTYYWLCGVLEGIG